jgi:hypothetical protein
VDRKPPRWIRAPQDFCPCTRIFVLAREFLSRDPLFGYLASDWAEHCVDRSCHWKLWSTNLLSLEPWLRSREDGDEGDAVWNCLVTSHNHQLQIHQPASALPTIQFFFSLNYRKMTTTNLKIALFFIALQVMIMMDYVVCSANVEETIGLRGFTETSHSQRELVIRDTFNAFGNLFGGIIDTILNFFRSFL